jgi:hypothetical protein
VKFTDDIALAFSEVLSPAERLELLSRRYQVLQAMLEAVRSIPSHPGMAQFVIDHQRVHLESELRWMDELMEKISTNSKKGKEHESA